MTRVVHGDCFEELDKLPTASVHLCLTDPPYGLDKLGREWSVDEAQTSSVVTSLPPVMKFDPRQGYALAEWTQEVSEKVLRVLKPGAFYLVFCAPRLYHRVACAVEDAGFWVRDLFEWLYTTGQPKAMSLTRFGAVPPEWKTPQVKPAHEPILVAQKPAEGTLTANFERHGVGLINTACRIGGDCTRFPANVLCDSGCAPELQRVFLVPKPGLDERREGRHMTQKPVALCEYLITLMTRRGDVVLDPFCGSGSTLVAAQNLGRVAIGIELREEYCSIARRRLALEGRRPPDARRAGPV